MLRWSDKSHKENMDPRVDRTKNMNPKSYTMTTMTFNFLQNIDMKWWESTTYPMHQAIPPEISISHPRFIINYVSHYVNHQSQSFLIITTAAASTYPNHHQNTIISSSWSSTSQPLSQLPQSQGCTDFSAKTVKLETASCQCQLSRLEGMCTKLWYALSKSIVRVFRLSMSENHACTSGEAAKICFFRKNSSWNELYDSVLEFPKQIRSKVTTLQLTVTEMESSNSCLSKGHHNSLPTFTKWAISVGVSFREASPSLNWDRWDRCVSVAVTWAARGAGAQLSMGVHLPSALEPMDGQHWEAKKGRFISTLEM